MAKALGLALVLIAVAASATPDHICVRNYLKGQKDYDPCANLADYGYAYAKPIPGETEGKICTRVYSEFYCGMAKTSYVHIPTASGGKICTMDYNQPGVINYCKSVPQYYDYVSPSAEDED